MIRTWIEARRREPLIKNISDGIALLIALAGVGVSIFMNSVGRSLWVDEAMLSYSFSKRSLLSLTSEIFEWDQSAPVLYLYIVKLLTLLFGNTEAVLRSFSIVCFVLVLALSVYAGRRLFHMRHPLWIAAFMANMNFMLDQSNMFKQYMSEAVWVLLTILIYDAYKTSGLSFGKTVLAFMILLWGANPVCFMLGGILIVEFFEGAWGLWRSRRLAGNAASASRETSSGLMKRAVIAGVCILASFALNYFLWLRGIANSPSMQAYWDSTAFPLIPTSVDDVKMALAFVYEIFITFREARLFMEFLVLAAFAIGIFKEKNRYAIAMGVGFVIALFASSIHMFPIADRLWCFAFPLFVILAFYALDRGFRVVADRTNWAPDAVFFFLMMAFLFSNNGISVYRHAENVFKPGEEINSNIDYVADHIIEGETVYVYYYSVPVVQYRIGYDTDRIGDVAEDNIIWGEAIPKEDSELPNIEKALSADGCYILASHCPIERIGRLFEMARERGTLEVVQSQYDTNLYYYAKDGAGRKGAVAYEVLEQETEDDTCYVTVRVTNTGSAFINDDASDVRLGSPDRGEIGTNLWHNLRPGESFDMPLSFDWNGDTEVRLALSEGSLGFDAYAASPVIVRKGE